MKSESVESENMQQQNENLEKGKQTGKYNKVNFRRNKLYCVIEFEVMTKQNGDTMKSESEKCGK